MNLATLLAWITPGTDKHSCSLLISMSTPKDTGCQMMTSVEFKPFMVCITTDINVGLNYGGIIFTKMNQDVANQKANCSSDGNFGSFG